MNTKQRSVGGKEWEWGEQDKQRSELRIQIRAAEEQPTIALFRIKKVLLWNLTAH